MKKLVAIIAVLAMALASFAGITADGPNFDVSVSGNIDFGLYFDENGLELDLVNSAIYSASNWMSVTITGENVDVDYPATLTVNFDAAVWGAADTSVPISSATYEDNMFEFGFMNYSYKSVVNNFFLASWDSTGDGAVDNPIGTQYMTANYKGIDLDFTYIDLTTNNVSKHSTTNVATSLIAGDIMAVNYPFAYELGSGNVNAALWSANKTRANDITLMATTTDGEYLGFGAGADWAGVGMVEGLSIDAAFAMQSATDVTALDKMGYRFFVGYEKAFSVLEDPAISVTPHADFDYTVGSPAPYARTTTDASVITAGVDAEANLGMAGVFGLYDTVTYGLGASPALSYEYGVTYSNEEIHDLFKVSAEFGKMDSTEIATPFGLTAKVWGGMSEDMYAFDYMVELTDNGLVPLTAMASATDKYVAYALNASVYPVEKVSIDASLYNFNYNSDGTYNVISKIAEPVWTLDATYKPNTILSLGGHLGTEENWGDFTAIHWYLFAKASFSF